MESNVYKSQILSIDSQKAANNDSAVALRALQAKGSLYMNNCAMVKKIIFSW